MIELLIAVAGIAVMVRLIPSFMLYAGFSYPNAKFSAIPNSYIKEREVARLLELKNLEDIKNNVVSRDFILEGETAREIQQSVDASLVRIISMAKNDSPSKVQCFYDAYLEKIDAETIKKAVKSIMEGKETEGVAFSDAGKELLEKLSGAERDDVIPILREHGYNVVPEMSYDDIENAIDRRSMEQLLSVRLPASCRKARDKFVKTMIDIRNIKTILRGKQYGFEHLENYILPGGWELSQWQIREILKTGTIPEIISMLEGTSYMPYLRQAITEFETEGVVALERALDRCLIQMAGDISNDNTLALGPGIRFLVEKELEARNLKIIVKAVAEGLQEDARKVVVTV